MATTEKPTGVDDSVAAEAASNGDTTPKQESFINQRSVTFATRAHGTSVKTIQVCVTASLGGFLFGFISNAVAGSLAQPSFIAKFLRTDAAAKQDGLFGAMLGGGLVGSILQAPISNRLGRRVANLAAALIAMVSGALLSGAVNFPMLAVARSLSGIAAGMVFANSPVYMSEVAPPHTRGLLVGLQGIGVVAAYILCALCSLIFSFVHEEYAWRLVFVVLTAVSVAFAASLYFLPESPRWLMQHGRFNEAREILANLHATPTDPNGVFAYTEFAQIKAQIEEEQHLPKGYLYIAKTPHLRRRAIVSILIFTLNQGTGIMAVANLVPTLMGGLGFGTTMQLGLGVIWCVCCMVGSGINVYLMDRVGRVRLFVAGGFGVAVIIALMAALIKAYLGTTNLAGIRAIVALYFILAGYFTSTIECTSYSYAAEIWPTHLRSEGATIAYTSFFVNSLWTSTAAPTALQTIGWKYYMVFIAITVTATIAAIFLFPETKGLTLEEINAKFGDPVALDIRAAAAAERDDTSGHVLTHAQEA